MKVLARIDTLVRGLHQRTKEVEVTSAEQLSTVVNELNEKATGGRYYIGYMPGTHWRA